jgi:hypothetical protein
MSTRISGRARARTSLRPRVTHGALALVALVATVGLAPACSKGTDATSTGTSLQGPVNFPNPGSAPGSTAAPTIPPEAQLPKGTDWPGAPDPCSLATEKAVRAVTRFNVTSSVQPAKTPTGGPTKVCLFKNQAADIEGGSVTITVLPPGTDVGRDLASLTDVQYPTGIGQKAVAGHVKNNPTGGEGMNVIAVDMGDGGFSIGAFVFADIDDQAMLDLARQAAQNWKVTSK